MPPPMPVMMPSNVAANGDSPKAKALPVPSTAYSASPAASNISTGLRRRSMMRCQRNVTRPANIAVAR